MIHAPSTVSPAFPAPHANRTSGLLCLTRPPPHSLQCTKLEPLAAFDGKKHSCRASLLKRHHRQSQLSAAHQQHSSSSGEEQPVGRSKGSRQRGTSGPLAVGQAAVPELLPGATAAPEAAPATAGQGPDEGQAAPRAQGGPGGGAAEQGAQLTGLLAELGEHVLPATHTGP